MEKNFSPREMSYIIIATKFHVSLTKHRSDLLEKTQNHIRNLQGISFALQIQTAT